MRSFFRGSAAVIGSALVPAVLLLAVFIADYRSPGPPDTTLMIYRAMQLAFGMGLAYALFGLSIANFLRRYGRVGALKVATLGFAMGAGPTAIVWIGGSFSAVGRYGLSVLTENVPYVLMAGLLGVVGGLVGWAVWRGSFRAPWAWLVGLVAVAAGVLVGPSSLIDPNGPQPQRPDLQRPR